MLLLLSRDSIHSSRIVIDGGDLDSEDDGGLRHWRDSHRHTCDLFLPVLVRDLSVALGKRGR